MKIFLDKLLNLLFPKNLKCIFCGKDIPNFNEKPYCDHCEKNLPFNNGHKCKICDMEIVGEGEVCELCKTNHKSFDKACSVFKYEGKVRNIILKLKDSNAKYLVHPMAKLMSNTLPDSMKDFDLIIPVPSSAKSMKKRGYNHAKLLAEEISKLTNVEMRSDILIKHKETLPQKSLSFKERHKNLVDAFKLTSRKDIKDKTILLIDDVMTTSATSNACSHLLKRHCKKVYVLTFARNTINFDKK